jgi:hypothetical protein
MLTNAKDMLGEGNLNVLMGLLCFRLTLGEVAEIEAQMFNKPQMFIEVQMFNLALNRHFAKLLLAAAFIFLV